VTASTTAARYFARMAKTEGIVNLVGVDVVVVVASSSAAGLGSKRGRVHTTRPVGLIKTEACAPRRSTTFALAGAGIDCQRRGERLFNACGSLRGWRSGSNIVAGADRPQ